MKIEMLDNELDNVIGGLKVNLYEDEDYNGIGINSATEYRFWKKDESAVYASIAATKKRLGYKDDAAALADLIAAGLVF